MLIGMKQQRTAIVALAAAGALWGLTVPLSKLGLEWLGAGWLAVVRFAIAAPLLALVARGRLRAALTPGVLPDPLNPGYFVWSVGASAQLLRALSGYVTYRTLASVDSVTSNELTWGLRFETPLR